MKNVLRSVIGTRFLSKRYGNGGLVWLTYCAVLGPDDTAFVSEWVDWVNWRKEYERVYWL